MIIINRLILFILLFGVSHAAIILDSKLQAVNNTNFAIISNRNDLEITFPRFYIQDTQEVKLINYTTYRTYNILDTKNYANFSIKIGYLLFDIDNFYKKYIYQTHTKLTIMPNSTAYSNHLIYLLSKINHQYKSITYPYYSESNNSKIFVLKTKLDSKTHQYFRNNISNLVINTISKTNNNINILSIGELHDYHQ